jgi:histidinol phosphatase-like enzyme (inositol monophosphatase family)
MTIGDGALLQAVSEIANVAGRVALSHFGGALSVEHKSDGSPVTIADRAAEQAAHDWVDARFPEDGIAGEELDALRPTARRQWLIDPIDGTKTFVRGVPLWGTLVAVCEGRDVLAGAAFFPALDELVVAERGAGAWWNGARCHVSSVASMANALVVATDCRFSAVPERKPDWDRLAARSAMSRSWGDCYGYLLVATGRAEVMVDPVLADWDAAALLPVIVEAGGTFTDWSGRSWAFGKSAVATNAALSADARTLLGIPTSHTT